MMTGIEAFLEILAAAGLRYVFGNPGTTELPLNDALARDTRFQYLLGLSEIPVMAMADGYSMASGRPGVVNVHIACGLGNSMGMLYNAWVEGTPLIVTAGQQDRRLRFGEPVLDGDLVRVARPWTKWAAEVQRVEDVPSAVRRAIQTALAPPTGPVFLSLPVDLQMESRETFDLSAPHVIDRRIGPPSDALQRAAQLLANAQRPAILAGSRVTESGGCAALARLAERLGAPVFAENTTAHGRLPIAPSHPLYQGILPYWSPQIRQRLAEFDVLLIVGMHALRLYIHQEPERPIPEHVRLVQLDIDPWQIGKNFPVEVGLLSDPARGLEELECAITTEQSDDDRVRAVASGERWMQTRREAQEQLSRELAAARDVRPLTALGVMGAIARVLPPNAAVVEEAITTHQNVLERLGVLSDPAAHFAHRGWALGWGLGCALGVKLAWPERPVLGLLGDGAALYGIQGLWSAAHHRIPVTFVVCNNSQYRILKVCGDVMPLPEMARRNYLGMDLVDPAVDFVQLAQAFGVKAERTDGADELSDRLAAALAADEPRLIEVTMQAN